MFSGCKNLKSIDFTGKNTAKVKYMLFMFEDCESLADLDVSMIKTDNVLEANGMFKDCKSLTFLDVSNLFTQNKLKSYSDMFIGCTNLKELDISGFINTSKKQCQNMFKNCSNLTTIWTNGNFGDEVELDGREMFTGCDKLVGDIAYPADDEWHHDDADYAKVQGGYFTFKGTPYGVYDSETNTLTFKYSKKGETLPDDCYKFEYDNKGYLPWSNIATTVQKVVFDENFKNYRPTRCSSWFFMMYDLKEIEGLKYLNTSRVTDMSYMFELCRLTNLDLSTFKTENVTTMKRMFYFALLVDDKKELNIDLSSFKMDNVKDVEDMLAISASKNNMVNIKIGDFHINENVNIKSFLLPENISFYTSPDKYASNKEHDTHNLISSGLRIYIPAGTAEYGTICVPQGCDLNGNLSGFDKLYTATTTSDDGSVVMSKADKMEPGVPYVFHRCKTDGDVYADAITFTPNSDDEAAEPVNDNSLLHGTFAKMQAPEGSFVLQKDSKFHIVGADKAINVGAYKAFLKLPEAAKASVFSIRFDDSATSINGINAADDSDNAPIYDLSGRRVNNTQKGGVYVKKGKKFVF